jgi:hypothetical protein
MRIGRAKEALSCLMMSIAEFLYTVVVKRGHGQSKCSKRVCEPTCQLTLLVTPIYHKQDAHTLPKR